MSTQIFAEENLEQVLREKFDKKYGNPPEISGWGQVQYRDRLFHVRITETGFVYIEDSKARDELGQLRLW